MVADAAVAVEVCERAGRKVGEWDAAGGCVHACVRACVRGRVGVGGWWESRWRWRPLRRVGKMVVLVVAAVERGVDGSSWRGRLVGG